jgi:hypothetical protein
MVVARTPEAGLERSTQCPVAAGTAAVVVAAKVMAAAPGNIRPLAEEPASSGRRDTVMAATCFCTSR